MLEARRSAGWIAAAVLTAAALCVLAGCSVSFGSRDTSTDRLSLLQGEFTRAAEALQSRDEAVFVTGLSFAGSGPGASAARASLRQVFKTLSPLPWVDFAFTVSPVDEAKGVYRVVGSGQLGAQGAPARIAVVRFVRVSDGKSGPLIAADATPESFRSRYLMALHDPVTILGKGIAVVADRRNRSRARTVMGCAVTSRARLLDMGVADQGDVLILLYSSVIDVRDAYGSDADAMQLRFFAVAPSRTTSTPWRFCDVGISAPWMDDRGDDLQGTMTHELAHAYTVGWFSNAAHRPDLLIEGIAEASVAGEPEYFLREEILSGNGLWPLPESFGEADLWSGGDDKTIRLGYEVGASLVKYVRDRWGAAAVKPFAVAVADSDLTEEGLSTALRPVLGVGWARFYAGWKRYALSSA